VFRGSYSAKVDEKGRLKVPSAFKQLLDAANVTQFYITSTDGKSAQIWPLPEWEKQEILLADYTLDAEVRKYIDLTSFFGQQVEMDNQARVLLPQRLREGGKLDAEVTVLGKLLFLDVQNEKALEERLPSLAMTAEELQSVGAKTRRRV